VNLRFSNYKKKNIFLWGGLLCVVLFISSVSFSLRTPVLAGLKFPLLILNALKLEIKALVFFHRDFYENAVLRKEIDYLKSKLNQAQEAALENKRLEDILSFKQKSSYRVIAARVIGFAPDSWSSAILIDRGRLNDLFRPGRQGSGGAGGNQQGLAYQ
jgi:cell shape-determining protein MreC